MSQEQPTSMRLDKWLWAARFFKTRKLATEAINGGKVHLNQQRSKPGKEVKIGTFIRIHKASLSWEIEVISIPKQRRPASEALHFYTEAEDSIKKRQQMIEEQRVIRQANPHQPVNRPNKKDRRLIHQFTRK